MMTRTALKLAAALVMAGGAMTTLASAPAAGASLVPNAVD